MSDASTNNRRDLSLWDSRRAAAVDGLSARGKHSTVSHLKWDRADGVKMAIGLRG